MILWVAGHPVCVHLFVGARSPASCNSYVPVGCRKRYIRIILSFPILCSHFHQQDTPRLTQHELYLICRYTHTCTNSTIIVKKQLHLSWAEKTWWSCKFFFSLTHTHTHREHFALYLYNRTPQLDLHSEITFMWQMGGDVSLGLIGAKHTHTNTRRPLSDLHACHHRLLVIDQARF